jgi:hypothetical protein
MDTINDAAISQITLFEKESYRTVEPPMRSSMLAGPSGWITDGPLARKNSSYLG